MQHIRLTCITDQNGAECEVRVFQRKFFISSGIYQVFQHDLTLNKLTGMRHQKGA